MLRLKSLHHVRFASSGPRDSERFAIDFGLHVSARDDRRTYLRGAGSTPTMSFSRQRSATPILGAAFLAESRPSSQSRRRPWRQRDRRAQRSGRRPVRHAHGSRRACDGTCSSTSRRSLTAAARIADVNTGAEKSAARHDAAQARAGSAATAEARPRRPLRQRFRPPIAMVPERARPAAERHPVRRRAESRHRRFLPPESRRGMGRSSHARGLRDGPLGLPSRFIRGAGLRSAIPRASLVVETGLAAGVGRGPPSARQSRVRRLARSERLPLRDVQRHGSLQRIPAGAAARRQGCADGSVEQRVARRRYFQ